MPRLQTSAQRDHLDCRQGSVLLRYPCTLRHVELLKDVRVLQWSGYARTVMVGTDEHTPSQLRVRT